MMRQIRAFGRRLIDGIARRSGYVPSGMDSLTDEEWLRESDSGELIGRTTAYSYAPWFRAIQLVSSCVAKTTLGLWEQDANGKWVKAKTHPAYRLLCGHHTPNVETLKYHFIQTLTAHAMGHGGGYAYIFRDKLGRPTELLQLRPDRTFPVREDGQLMFITCIGGDYGAAGTEMRKILAENMLHIHGLGWDGLTGYSVMEMAARALGSAIAKERFGARFFKNSATPGVIITTPRKLSDVAMKHLKESWQTLRTGIEQSHKPIILEDEAKAEAFTHNATDSQLMESVQWDPVVISNFTGVPPFLLGVKGYQSNSTLETQSQNLLDFTIDPWFLPWEQELAEKLLRESEKEAESHAWEFQRKDLIRVDAEKRSTIYRTALGGHPYMQIAEVRDDEGLDAIPGTDFIPEPLNMKSGSDPTSGGSGTSGQDTQALKDKIAELEAQLQEKPKKKKSRPAGKRTAFRQICVDTTGRMARRLHTARTRNSAMDKNAMLAEHGETLRAAFRPLAELSGGDPEARVERTISKLWDSLCEGRSPEQIAESITDQQFVKGN